MGYDVTVITPVFNGVDYIVDCVNSVASQKGVSVQHVVVDDGSSDGTFEAVSQFSTVLLIRQANAGAPAARNLGLSKAEGSYIKFLDADDYLQPDCLRRQLEVIRSTGNVKKRIGYGYRDIVWERRKFRRRKVLKVDLDQVSAGESVERQVANRISKNIMTSLPLYPSEALREVGGFDLRLRSSQEWNLNIRLALQGYTFFFDGVYCYTQRIHDSASRISNRKCDPESELANDKYTFEMLEDLLKHRCVREAWAQRLRSKAKTFIVAGFLNEGQRALCQANKLSGQQCIKESYGNPYRIFVRVFGEVGAAKIYGTFIRLARKILY